MWISCDEDGQNVHYGPENTCPEQYSGQFYVQLFEGPSRFCARLNELAVTIHSEQELLELTNGLMPHDVYKTILLETSSSPPKTISAQFLLTLQYMSENNVGSSLETFPLLIELSETSITEEQRFL